MQSWNCPGVAIAVVKGDQVLHQSVFGLRDVENQHPMTEDTRFAMASCTKSFTAMSVAILVDDGKLEWDKPIIEYMPEFILDDPYVTRHVTVRDMLAAEVSKERWSGPKSFASRRLNSISGSLAYSTVSAVVVTSPVVASRRRKVK